MYSRTLLSRNYKTPSTIPNSIEPASSIPTSPPPPKPQNHHPATNTSPDHPLATSLHITARTPIAPGTELRILPLGDSITYGWNGTAGTDGYRLKLSTDLSGSDLLFIGTQRSGSMSDNYNEGYPGFTISRIAAVAGPALAMRPNIVLLHAGTNDLHKSPPPANESYADAPARLGALVDEVVERCPGAVVLVAQIISAVSASTEARIRAFNEAVPGVVRERGERGEKVAVVDMSGVGVGELVDGLHPTTAGYAHMGDLWFAGLQAVAQKGWITPPVGPDLTLL